MAWARDGRSSKSRDTICESESTEYRCWASMLQRCTNPNNPAYKNYGGRGIQVCERWQTYANFLEDMGRRPASKDSIDRIDNDGDYEPDNCRWATWKTQSITRRPRGPSPDSIASLVRDHGLTKNRLYSRINKGMSAEEAIADVKKPNMSELAREAGMSRQLLWHRLNVQEMTPDMALSAPVRGR